jgi:hypothetical protein
MNSPTSQPQQPIRAALSDAFNYLERCEVLVRELRTHLFPSTVDTPPPISTAKAPELPKVHSASNELVARLGQLGDDLSALSASF